MDLRTLIGQWHESHARELKRILSRFIGPREAEDLCQDTFMRLLAANDPARVERVGNPIKYLTTVAMNAWRDQKKAVASRVQGSSAPLEDDAFDGSDWVNRESPEEAAGRMQMNQRLRAAQGHLTELERRIIEMTYEEELSCRQIAGILGKSKSFVNDTLNQAMRRLDELMHDASRVDEPEPQPEADDASGAAA